MEQDSDQRSSDVLGWAQAQLSPRKDRPAPPQSPATTPQAHVAADLATRAWQMHDLNLGNDLAKFLHRRIGALLRNNT
eukprot:5673987-Heterocapsa_arctica.AAC.1